MDQRDFPQLPPGFRFHPTDEELVSFYLLNKFLNSEFKSQAIGEADLNKCEPWDLPKNSKLGGKEWYLFCMRDRKYPTGLRTNRATDSGYWKATGKDKGVYSGKLLVGMKKTLVFYRGRAPRGEKSDWVMHEYRLEGKYAVVNMHGASKNDWVLCRVYKKSALGSGKKGKMAAFSYKEEIESDPPLVLSLPPTIPPLIDLQTHVPCFSIAQEHDMWMTSNFFFSKLLEQGNGKGMEMLSASQETGLTEINAEITSDNEIGRNSFDACLWSC